LAWTVRISNVAERQVRKLDRPVQRRILDWLNDRIEGCKNPRHFGEPVKGSIELNGSVVFGVELKPLGFWAALRIEYLPPVIVVPARSTDVNLR